ncbi:MAG: hypothetical protein HYW23_02560 [Candidatus Aenigmarchaeota archaeon]|nr:hypothetical protein [Candidatus Aenigmarchaeota archaeon]
MLAVILGLFPSETVIPAATVTAVLVVLGIIVGLVNVSARESNSFLLAAIALLIAGVAGYGGASTGYTGLYSVLPVIGGYLSAILANISTFVAPAAVIVAIKEVYLLARKA